MLFLLVILVVRFYSNIMPTVWFSPKIIKRIDYFLQYELIFEIKEGRISFFFNIQNIKSNCQIIFFNSFPIFNFWWIICFFWIIFIYKWFNINFFWVLINLFMIERNCCCVLKKSMIDIFWAYYCFSLFVQSGESIYESPRLKFILLYLW